MAAAVAEGAGAGGASLLPQPIPNRSALPKRSATSAEPRIQISFARAPLRRGRGIVPHLPFALTIRGVLPPSAVLARKLAARGCPPKPLASSRRGGASLDHDHVRRPGRGRIHLTVAPPQASLP